MTIAMLRPDEVAHRADVKEAWAHLIALCQDHYVMYRSPVWWDHLVATRSPEGLFLGVVSDAQNAIRAIIPLQSAPCLLPIEVGRRTLGALRMSVWAALGGQPLVCERCSIDPAELWAGIIQKLPQNDGIFLKSVGMSTDLWAALNRPVNSSAYYTYSIESGRPLYSIALPESFDAYLGGFSTKSRYNLRRSVKIFRTAVGGELALERVDQASQVRPFVDGAKAVLGHAWKRDMPDYFTAAGGVTDLEDVATRGLLRSYLLTIRGEPCAFVNGYQYRGVFHYADVAYDERYAKYSPGTVLLFLLIQDLFAHRSPECMSFGIGYADYKRLFATDVQRDASVLVLRRNMKNRLKSGLHRGYCAAKSLARAKIRATDA
jgi:Acetyltransferase (GNAT) domain